MPLLLLLFTLLLLVAHAQRAGTLVIDNPNTAEQNVVAVDPGGIVCTFCDATEPPVQVGTLNSTLSGSVVLAQSDTLPSSFVTTQDSSLTLSSNVVRVFSLVAVHVFERGECLCRRSGFRGARSLGGRS